MSKKSEKSKQTKRPWLTYLVTLGLFFTFGAIGGVFWFEGEERFPRFAPGVYIGSIQGIQFDDGLQAASFYLERQASSDNFKALVLAPGFSLSLVKPIVQGDDSQSTDWFFPITLEGSKLNLKFSGEPEGDNIYRGKVVELNSSSQGSWELEKKSESLPVISKAQQSDLSLWLMLKAELLDIEARIDKAQQLAPEQKKEIERLTQYVTEGVSLKTKGEQRYNQERSKFKVAVETLKAKQKEARDLEARIELSQRLTPMGKLVSLARDSLEREGRWLESMLRAGSSASKPSLDAAFARGQEILNLRSAIIRERERITQIESGDLG